MGLVAEVVSVDGDDVKVDEEDPRTPEHYQPAGDDAKPLRGDYAAISGDDEGSSSGSIVAFHDTVDANRKAAPGEKRIYARDATGQLVGDVWLKGDGTMVMQNHLAPLGGIFEIKADGTVVINGVEFSPLGVVKCLDVSVSLIIPAGLSLAGHAHPTAAAGAPSLPVPGPPPPP
jgi:hypothetical protein